MTIQTTLDCLTWLANQGARFALPRGRTKGKFEADWQNKPHTVEEAIAHAQRGGNVGLLTGKHSGGIIAIDRDIDYPQTVAMLGELANTVKIERDNAPGRGKLLYKVAGALPPSTVWKADPNDKNPSLELLSTGRHAIIPPSEYDGGRYKLIDAGRGVKSITTSELEAIWFLITGEALDKSSKRTTNRATDKSAMDDYKELVRDAWPTKQVFERFHRNGKGEKPSGHDTRLLGNGGLLIHEWRWYNMTEGVGGDEFDAWSWCKHGHIVDRTDWEGFWAIVREMGDAAGIDAPTSDDSDDGDDSQQKGSGKQAKEAKPKQADELYKLALKLAHFFQGRQDGQLYASVAVDGHRECYRMKSERFNDWLSFAYFQQHGTAVSAQARADAKNLLAFEARKCVEDVFVRVGYSGDKVYIDLGSPEGDAIEVDASGWRIVPIPPVHFRRPETMLPLPLPSVCNDPLLLRQYLNIEDADWPLLAAWVVAALHPRGPYPVLAFLSRAGSGKSTQLRVLKRIIDPSAAELRSQPGDVRDLFIAAANSWVLAFDNVSQLSSEVSDALCVIATGGGFTRKANYTDQEESVINAQRPILINGIGDIIARQDLMDRAIVVGTPYISEERRLDEEDFWRGFEQDKAKLLGAFLYALSRGLANAHTVTLERKPRMADFAKIAVASESAYTDTRHGFMAAYTENRDRAADTIIENSPVGEVLLRVMGSADRIEETPQALFLKMQAEATNEYERKADGWPKHHNQLKEVLERIAPALDRLGVRVEHKRTNGKRLLVLMRSDFLPD